MLLRWDQSLMLHLSLLPGRNFNAPLTFLSVLRIMSCTSRNTLTVFFKWIWIQYDYLPTTCHNFWRNLRNSMQETQGSIFESGRSPGEGNGNPLQYCCLRNPMDTGAWWATVHRVAKNQKQLITAQLKESSGFSFYHNFLFFLKDIHHIAASSFESVLPLIVLVGNATIVH